MQGLWYGDRRDRVKWGALVYLAGRFRLASILQVAYFRDGSERSLRVLETDQGNVEIADAVWQHFVDLRTVERLSGASDVQICVHLQVFDPEKRREYINAVVDAAQQLPRPRLLFLDPDTGIEPGNLKPEHTSRDDVTRLWEFIEPREVLAVYQHKQRGSADWVNRSIRRMEESCQGAKIQSIKGTAAGDVAILWGRKERVSLIDPQRAPTISEVESPSELYWVLQSPAPLAGMRYPRQDFPWKNVADAGFHFIVALHLGDYDPSPLEPLSSIQLEDLVHGGNPADPPEEMRRIRTVVEASVEVLRSGRGVIVHCAGGRGRSGTVIGGILRTFGYVAEEVIAYLDRLHKARGKPGWPESPWQADLIRQWRVDSDQPPVVAEPGIDETPREEDSRTT